MATQQRVTLAWVTCGIAALLYSIAWAQIPTPDGPSVETEYCSTVNTADMVGPFNYNWQSQGRCVINCTDFENAFAIVQDKNCWCSNLIPHPNDRKPLEDCQADCPGYPTDYCGGDGTFGYMEIGGFSPEGTADPVATRKPSPTSSTVQPPTVTVILPEPSSSVTSSSSSSSDASTTSSDDSSDPPSMTTITADGTIKTVIVTPNPTGNSDEAHVENKGGGLESGAIAGIVVGVIGGLAVVIGVFVWLWCAKRKRQNEDGVNGLGSPIRGGSGSPGTMATPNTGEISENRFAAGADAQKRRSHLMPIDPRLDPFAKGIYAGDQNRSRESFNSLQDNQDYSRRVHQPGRVLRATNPDPDVD